MWSKQSASVLAILKSGIGISRWVAQSARSRTERRSTGSKKRALLFPKYRDQAARRRLCPQRRDRTAPRRTRRGPKASAAKIFYQASRDLKAVSLANGYGRRSTLCSKPFISPVCARLACRRNEARSRTCDGLSLGRDGLRCETSADARRLRRTIADCAGAGKRAWGGGGRFRLSRRGPSAVDDAGDTAPHPIRMA